MLSEYFHERLLWYPKLPCNFHKNVIYVISTLFLIILSNISFLAQRVHVSEILGHFPKSDPLVHGVFMIRPEQLYLFLQGDAPYASCKISA